MSGCIAWGRFYPVQGPLSAQAPVPVFKAEATGWLMSGEMSVKLEGGEVCKGRWSATQAAPEPTAAPPASGADEESLASVWDIVYGQGFYVSHVLGRHLFARAKLAGDKGTVLRVEVYKPDSASRENTRPARGVAKDNKGNIYKVVF